MTPDQPSDDEEAEEHAWQRLVTEQFFKGYAESDSIYDQLADDAGSAPPSRRDGVTEART